MAGYLFSTVASCHDPSRQVTPYDKVSISAWAVMSLAREVLPRTTTDKKDPRKLTLHKGLHSSKILAY
jgi:hypothetical protein